MAKVTDPFASQPRPITPGSGSPLAGNAARAQKSKPARPASRPTSQPVVKRLAMATRRPVSRSQDQATPRLSPACLSVV
jgi:hypothetical protein